MQWRHQDVRHRTPEQGGREGGGEGREGKGEVRGGVGRDGGEGCLQEKEGQRRYDEKEGSGEVTDRRSERKIVRIMMHRNHYTISRTEQRTAIYNLISLISIS